MKKNIAPFTSIFQKVLVKWAIFSLLGLPRSRHTSVIQGGGGGQARGVGRTSFANWELNGPWLLWYVSQAQTQNQRQQMEEIFTKITNYVQDYGSCPLPRSLSIDDDQDL